MHRSCRALRSAVPPPGVVTCIGEPGLASEATLFNRNLQDERAPLAIVKPSSLSQLQAVLETAMVGVARSLVAVEACAAAGHGTMAPTRMVRT